MAGMIQVLAVDRGFDTQEALVRRLDVLFTEFLGQGE
jgi:hypothetical protein